MIERSTLPEPERNEGLVGTFTEFFEEHYADVIDNLENLHTSNPTLLVSFDSIRDHNANMVEMIYEQPDKAIHNAKLAAEDMAGEDVDEVTVRFDEPFDERRLGIREIREEDVGDLVSIEGIVSQHIEVKPKIEVGVFRCSSCRTRNTKRQPAENLTKPFRCVNEDCNNTTSSNFHVLYEESKTVNFQKIRVQESPSGLEGGEDPQKIDVLLRGDITGKVKGGEKVIVSGVLRTTESQDRAVLNTYIDANNLEKEDKGTEDMDITDEEENEIKEYASRDDIYDVISHSIAPSIKGHEIAKRGAAFQAFGGVRKQYQDSSTTIRGDIHVLYVGDPGVGKSQILQYIKNISTSGVYTSGKGSSAAGLCVGGDTTIQYEGELISIKELVDEYIDGSVDDPTAVQNAFETVGFNFDTNQTEECIASHIWKMPEQVSVNLSFGDSTELTISPQTPLLTVSGSEFEWVDADDIRVGDTVVKGEYSEARSKERVVADGGIETATVTGRSESVEELYDLTTEFSNFVANGLVVHNTASAIRDAEFGGNDQWTLKAGAMVIADKGIACIDELDKMSDNDRSSMHEALEQQQVSISKAGINATLKSRCSLLAAANPVHGRFDEYEPVPEQINLEPALISRFDLIFIIQDLPEKEKDTEIADHILARNRKGQENANRLHQGEDITVMDEDDDTTAAIGQDLLRKYIAYAKRNIYPEMTDSASEAIRDFYVDLRNEEVDSDAIPITARKLEGLVRLTEASARMRLSKTATVSDARRAIEIMKEHLKQVGMDPETGEFDADMLESGTTQSQRDKMKTILKIIEVICEEKEEDGESRAVAMTDEIVERAEEKGIDAEYVEDKLQEMGRKGRDIYSPGSKDGYRRL